MEWKVVLALLMRPFAQKARRLFKKQENNYQRPNTNKDQSKRLRK